MTDHLETDNDKSWWAGPWFLVSAVLVALLVVLGLVLWLWPEGQEQSQSQPAPATAAEAPSGGESVCGLSATGGTTLTKAPKDVEWEALGAIYAPASKKHGPGAMDESTRVRSCYSHTPEGALLASTNMLISGNDPQVLLDTIEARVMEGPGKNIAIGQAQQRVGENDTTTVPLEVAGFRLLSYTDDKATVEVVLAADDGTEKVYTTTATDMVWYEGDWRFLLQDDGSGGPVSGQISDLSGYIQWNPDNG